MQWLAAGMFTSCLSLNIHRMQWTTTRRRLAMNVDLIFKIAAVGILVAVLNMLLSRSGRDDQALMTSIAGLLVVLVIIVQEISDLFDLIRELFGF